MNVIHVIDSGGFYGAESMLVQLSKEQAVLGHSILVLSIGQVDEPEKEIESVLISKKINVKKWRMPNIPTISEVRKLLSFLNSTKCDVVHSHGYKGNILIGFVSRRFREFSFVSTLHGYTSHPLMSKMTFYQYLDRLALTRVDAVALVSHAMRSTVQSVSKGKNVHVIENGIDTVDEVEGLNGNLYGQDKKGGKSLTIGSLGRLSKEKNFSLLVSAMPEILKKMPSARLIIHGEGPERQLLQNLIRDLNLEACVSIRPYTKDVIEFMSRVDIFVNCSTTEGMPISLLEAMRSGKLIVATDIPANRALLGSVDKVGALSPLDRHELVQAIERVYTLNPEAKIDQATAYREYFLKNYTSGAMAKRYDKLYQGAMKNFAYNK